MMHRRPTWPSSQYKTPRNGCKTEQSQKINPPLPFDEDTRVHQTRSTSPTVSKTNPNNNRSCSTGRHNARSQENVPSPPYADFPPFNGTNVAPLSRRVQGGGVAEQDATTRAVLGAARSETIMCRWLRWEVYRWETTIVERRCQGCWGEGCGVGATAYGRCVEDWCVSRVHSVGNWGGRGYQEGRVYGNYRVETIGSRAVMTGAVMLVAAVSRRSCRGLWCRGSSVWWLLCRGYRVGSDGVGGCCEMRVHEKSMRGDGFGGGSGRYCGKLSLRTG